jgi:hypothetical protein
MRYVSVEDMKRLLGVRFIPGSPEEIEVPRAWTQNLVQEEGEVYFENTAESSAGIGCACATAASPVYSRTFPPKRGS